MICQECGKRILGDQAYLITLIGAEFENPILAVHESEFSSVVCRDHLAVGDILEQKARPFAWGELIFSLIPARPGGNWDLQAGFRKCEDEGVKSVDLEGNYAITTGTTVRAKLPNFFAQLEKLLQVLVESDFLGFCYLLFLRSLGAKDKTEEQLEKAVTVTAAPVCHNQEGKSYQPLPVELL
jgi:hypothetical protein